MLRKNGAGKAALGARNFDRQAVHVGEEALDWQDRHGDGREDGATDEKNESESGLEPDLTNPVDGVVDQEASGGEVQRVDGRKVKVLALHDDKNPKADHLPPSPKPVAPQAA